jgi:acyl-CoA reductase-like NAD-dependent aldehyde dehydrogenase
MRIAWEEPFGPVVPIMRVATAEEAVAHCNANNLALQVQAAGGAGRAGRGGRAGRSALGRERAAPTVHEPPPRLEAQPETQLFPHTCPSPVSLPTPFPQGCVFTRDVNKAITISDAMETGTVQVGSGRGRCRQRLAGRGRGGAAGAHRFEGLAARLHQTPSPVKQGPAAPPPAYQPPTQPAPSLLPPPSPPTTQINAAPARGPDHFPFQGFRDSGIGSQGIRNSLAMMVKTKSTVINLDKDSYASG